MKNNPLVIAYNVQKYSFELFVLNPLVEAFWAAVTPLGANKVGTDKRAEDGSRL